MTLHIIVPINYDPPPSSFNAFETISINTLHELVTFIHTSVTYIIPARLLIQVFDVNGPCILSIINKSLSLGFVPDYLKYAFVKPVEKIKP